MLDKETPANPRRLTNSVAGSGVEAVVTDANVSPIRISSVVHEPALFTNRKLIAPVSRSDFVASATAGMPPPTTGFTYKENSSLPARKSARRTRRTVVPAAAIVLVDEMSFVGP